MTTLLLAVLAFLPVQDPPKDAPDIIQLKDQSLLVGKIVKVDDKGVTIELKSGGRVERTFAELAPYTAYKIKSTRIDAASGPAHFALGEFCLEQGLYAYATLEFDKAVELDAKLGEAASKKKAEVRTEDGRSKFEEAKRLVSEKKYEEASKVLSTLVEKYGDTDYAAEARKEMAKVAEEIRKENELRQKELEARRKAKEDEKAKKAEEGDKTLAAQILDGLEEARKAWAEGLDWEGKGNLTKADRAFKTAEARLAVLKRHAETLTKANDGALAKQGKELDHEIDGWVVRTCFRLGRMWAAETNYTEALHWLNRGLKISPDDALMNEVLMRITEVQIRRRSSTSTAPKGLPE